MRIKGEEYKELKVGEFYTIYKEVDTRELDIHTTRNIVQLVEIGEYREGILHYKSIEDSVFGTETIRNFKDNFKYVLSEEEVEKVRQSLLK